MSVYLYHTRIYLSFSRCSIVAYGTLQPMLHMPVTCWSYNQSMGRQRLTRTVYHDGLWWATMAPARSIAGETHMLAGNMHMQSILFKLGGPTSKPLS